MQALQVVQAHAASSLSAKSSSGRGSLARREIGKILFNSALIDQNRRRAERFPGIRGRTNILAAVAHDAAIGIQQPGPGKFLQFGGGRPPRFRNPSSVRLRVCLFQRQIDRGHEEMDMLGTGEIWDEDENRTEGSPPKKMVQNLDNAGLMPEKNPATSELHRMKSVGALAGQLGCLEHAEMPPA